LNGSPERGRFSNPSNRSFQKRWCHLLTSCRGSETRLGPIKLDIPQVSEGVDFYPSALQKGHRSEQALKLALAEMYGQGVSTRKVTAIVEALCGTSVSSAHVSECTKLLDTELQKWRERPLGTFPYLVVDGRPIFGWSRISQF
jgi:transposase-like protein